MVLGEGRLTVSGDTICQKGSPIFNTGMTWSWQKVAGEWAEQALIFLPILVEKLDTFELHKPLMFWKFGRKEIFKRSVIYSLLISHEVFNQ